MRALLVAVAAGAVAATAGFFVWRRRARTEHERSELYESDGMVRVGAVPDAPRESRPQ